MTRLHPVSGWSAGIAARLLLVAMGWMLADGLRAESTWRLVWQDEFSGTRVDPAKWEFEVNADGGGNHELQYYLERNAAVADGHLVITARRERFTGPGGTRDYTSSRLRSRLKGDWTHGRFEMRARLPKGRGIWPAFWMMPTDARYGAWPHSGEIDIMELIGHQPSTVYGTLHWSDPTGRHTNAGGKFHLPVAGETFADGFHVFALEWESSGMRWFVDGNPYHSATRWPSDAGPSPRPFDQRFHLILNLAVGGDWPGGPDAETVFPQRFEIDYVRVYHRVTAESVHGK